MPYLPLIQINFILFLQCLGNWLLPVMQFFSLLGEENFIILVMPALYWSIDPAMGARVGLALMMSNGLNGTLKLVFHAPRPFWLDLRVKALVVQTDFGIPSGHAMNSVAVWGTISASYRKAWLWIPAIILIFMIGLSRLFLGVHFPTDVLVGWIFGALLVWLILRLEKPVTRWCARHSLGVNLGGALAVSLVLVLVYVRAGLALSGWQAPPAWVQNAIQAYPGSGPSTAFDPLALSGAFTSGGTLFGLAAGLLLLPSLGGFKVEGVWWKRLLRILVGALGVLLFWRGLDLVFPSGEYPVAYIFRFIRYGLVGVWVTAVAPVVFVWLKLARSNMQP